MCLAPRRPSRPQPHTHDSPRRTTPSAEDVTAGGAQVALPRSDKWGYPLSPLASISGVRFEQELASLGSDTLSGTVRLGLVFKSGVGTAGRAR